MANALTIVPFLNMVVTNLPHFASVLAIKDQKKYSREYVTGLIVCGKATDAAINT